MSTDERKRRPEGETFYINEQERVQILDRMKSIDMGKAELARECNVTPSAITLLLKKPIPPGRTRGCKFLGRLQRALGLADTTTKRRPMAVSKEAVRRAERIVQALDEKALDNWLASGEIMAERSEKR